MMRVQNESTAVETVDTAVLLKKQEKLIAALKQELLMHDALAERTGVVYEVYTPEQQLEVAQLVEQYVAASEREEESTLNIRSYRQMLEICKQFKRKLLEARANSGASSSMRAYTADNAAGDPALDKDPAFGGNNGGNVDLRGGKLGFTMDSNRGFALGETRPELRPPNGIEQAPSFGLKQQSEASVSISPPQTPQRRRPGPSNNSFAGNKDDQTQFEAFVKEDDLGARLFGDFTALKSAQRDVKNKVKQLSIAVNEAKFNIDQCTAVLESKKQSRQLQQAKTNKGAKSAEIVDEEEFRVAKQLKEAKQSYRNNYEQMLKLQSSAESMNKEAADLKERLSEALQRWQSQQTSPSRRFAANSMAFNNTYNNSINNQEDELDDQEAFDRLETERVLAQDPTSLAFFNAQKTMRANLTQSGGAIRMLQKNKRYG
jgi:kinesin family member 6/9